MRKILAVLVLLAIPAFAQVRESIEVNVLELDVAVLDRGGKPVDGLTSADFQVDIGKRAVDVTNFYAVKRGALVEQAPAQRAAAAPKALSPETMLPTTVVIFVDDTRLTQHGKARALAALRDYVGANLGPTTSAMVVRWNGALDIRTRPTERAGQIVKELERMANEPAMMNDSERRLILKTIDEAMLGITGNQYMHAVQNARIMLIGYADRELHDAEKTIKALKEVTKLASAFEGRKSLLYISEGLPLQPASDIFEYWDRMVRSQAVHGMTAWMQDGIAKDNHFSTDPMRYDCTQRYRELSRQAQAMNVNFYAIDVRGLRGLVTPGVDEMSRVTQISTLNYIANLQDGIRMVANESGGRLIANENDLGRAISVVSEQFNTYYSLGVSAPKSTRMERVIVKVKGRPELRVMTARHRRPLSREEQIERDVRSRLYLARAENPLDARVSVGGARPAGVQCVVPLRVDVARVQKAVDLYVALLDERQQESEVQSANILAADRGITHTMSLGVKPGKYVLSLAVADRGTGETSYVQHQIDASGCR
jgi:VWFA-related protein